MGTARVASGLTAATLGLMLSGCVFVGDLLNPSVAGAFGVPVPSQTIGSIVVRLKNDTAQAATLGVLAGTTENPFPLTVNTVAGGFENFVIDCPVPLLRPAGLTAGVTTIDLNSAAASVIGADGAALDITYTGSTLVSGAFDCGDVIEVRLVQVGTDVTAENFTVLVQVIKGS